jgi:hypothetical protein
MDPCVYTGMKTGGLSLTDISFQIKDEMYINMILYLYEERKREGKNNKVKIKSYN